MTKILSQKLVKFSQILNQKSKKTVNVSPVKDDFPALSPTTDESDSASSLFSRLFDQANEKTSSAADKQVLVELKRQVSHFIRTKLGVRDFQQANDWETCYNKKHPEQLEKQKIKQQEDRFVGNTKEHSSTTIFKMVHRRRKQIPIALETTFYDRPRDTRRMQPVGFQPKYLESWHQETFCMPLFFPSEESYNYFHAALSLAERTLYVCVYSITDNETADVLVDAKKRGVDVKVITDNDQMDAGKGADIQRLHDKCGIPFKRDNSDQFMHNKFAVIDKKVVMTGSFNWSLGARYKNKENILITNIPSVVDEYAEQFDKLWECY